MLAQVCGSALISMNVEDGDTLFATKTPSGYEISASEIDAANFFLELAASQENQEEEMSRLVNWLQINSEIYR